MILKKSKGIYKYICWDRALVLWEKNLPGRGLSKFEKHCLRETRRGKGNCGSVWGVKTV